ncbi:MAG: MraY family glycosyltransferase [Candidatus Auribacterota bacterium]|nr:MraY family glycosyltransferase [Candidatus Auribacterota bacterium]
MIYLIIFIIAVLVSSLVTPPIIRFASRRGITGESLGKREPSRFVPLLGGIAIFIAFSISTSLAFLISRGELLGEYDIHFMGLMLGSILILGLGIYDDIRGVKAPVKLIFQTIAAVILILCGYNLDIITNPFGGQIQLGLWGTPLTIIWIVGLTNAINLLDGLDGLACGVSGIAALTLFFSSLYGPPFMPVIVIGLAGACLGFLRYNLYPARIFLGDTGSLFLGFVLAAVSIQSSFKTTAGIALVLPLIALLLPITDTIIAFFRRIIGGKNPFQGDQRHLHYRLLSLGYSQEQTVRMLYLLTINLGIIALVMKYAGRRLAFGMLFLIGLILYLFLKIIEDFRFSIKGQGGDES